MPDHLSSSSLLSIELHPAFMAFGVKSSGSDRFAPIHIETNDVNGSHWNDLGVLSNWLKRHQNIWAQHFDKVIITLHDIPHTIVAGEEGADLALTALSGIQKEGYSFHLQAVSMDWSWSFAIPMELSQLLHNYFNKPRFQVGAHGMLTHLQRIHVNDDITGMYITPDMVQFIHLKEGRPVFSNVFNYTVKEDLLYYTLLTLQGLQLDPQSDMVIVGGLVMETSPLYDMLYQYIRNVQFLDQDLPVDVETLQKTGFPAHAFVNLIGAAS